MLYIEDHRPALLGLGTTFVAAGAHVIHSEIGDPHATLELVRMWLATIAQGVAILAGLASFAWYVYSIYKKKTEDDGSPDE